MTPFLSCILKANLALVLLYGFYCLCFRRDTFYGHIRWYLLTAIAAAAVFSLVDISGWLKGSPAAAIAVSQYIPDADAAYAYVFTLLSAENTAEPEVAKAIPFGSILWWCWLPVTVLMAGQRLFQLARLVRMRRRCMRHHCGNSAIIAIDSNMKPFSFFGHIFVNPSLYTKDELAEIVAHEQVHCRQGHTADILLAETLVCLCWFNPAAWLLRSDLRQNLEYYTDRRVLMSGFDRRHYQYSLLRVSGSVFQIVNNFYINNLKKRIIMMNKKDSPHIATVKYLLAVPALAAVLLAVQASGLQAEKTAKPDGGVNDPAPASVVGALTAVQMDGTSEKPVAMPYPTRKGEQLNVSATEITQSVADTTKKGIKFFRVVRNGSPAEKDMLIILNGKETSYNELNKIDTAAIELVEIALDKKFKDLYGEKAENGVVFITTKSGISKPDSPQQPGKQTAPFFIREGNEKGDVLVILDGKEISQTEMDKIDPVTIESFLILKDRKAKEKYGEKAANANRVIVITTKSGTSKSDSPQQPGKVENVPNYHIITNNRPFSFREGNEKEDMLIILDGKEISYAELKKIDSTIESFFILKGEKAKEKYGEKAANGVIVVTPKSGTPQPDNPKQPGKVETIPDYRIRQGTIYAPEGDARPKSVFWLEGNKIQFKCDTLHFRGDNFQREVSTAGMPNVINIEQKDNGVVLVNGSKWLPDGKPIIIVDGVKTSPIEKIPPAENIESVSVLKNQPAITLYGEEAKDGVVLITTKKAVKSVL